MTTTQPPWDLIVIGGGAAGLTAAIMAGEIGARVLLVDKERLGGDCTWAGCVPSKAFIKSARVAHAVRTAGAFGVQSSAPKIDFAAVMNRVRRIQSDIAAGETPERLAAHNVEVSFGGASFVDANTVRIGAERNERAEHFIIATGSSAAAPPIDGLVEAGFLNNENVFALEHQPKRLVVIGGGPIGCELGQAFARLGTTVTLLQRGERLLEREDEDISAHLLDALRAEHVDVRVCTSAVRVDGAGAEKVVHIRGPGGAETIRCDAVLVAVGRRANLDGLGLDAAGVQTSKRGITVNDRLHTNHKHIFAVGDCNGGPQFTHWAEHEARIATRNVLFRGWESRHVENIPWVTFTSPEVARLGLTASEARAAGHNVHIHNVGFDKVDRAVCFGQPEGFIRVVVADDDKILGVHIIGEDAGELLSEWVLALKAGLTLSDIGEAIHPYPTLNRANRRVADAAFFHHNVSGWKKSLFGTFRGPSTLED